MYKSFKFRLYLNKGQTELLNKSFGCSRFVYNYYLSNIKNNGYHNAYSNISNYVDNLKYEYPFLQEIDSIIIRKSLFYLDDNIKKFYNNGFGYPKYKSKFDKHSYTTSAVYRNYKNIKYCNIKLDLVNRKIKLPKLKWIDIIICERLTVERMLGNKKISKKISDASFSEIIRQLKYKSKYKKKLFYQIDTYYPSSQECSVCGSVDKKYKDLNERVYRCSKCQNEIDRDINASINIMFEGLKLHTKEIRI